MPYERRVLLRRALILGILVTVLAVRTAADAPGTVRVIVRIDAHFRPEGELGAGDVARQRAEIARSRGDFMAALAQGSYSVSRVFESIPFIAMEVTPQALESLRDAPGVAGVSEDRLIRPLLGDSVPLIGADTARSSGFTGSGWAVAILDTGVDGSHPFLSGKVVSEACYSREGSCPGRATLRIGPGSGAPCRWARYSCAHGTHVAGIAAGSGPGFAGVARDASVIAVRVFSRFTGAPCSGSGEDPCSLAWTSDLLAGLERIYALRSSYSIAAVNLSLGGGLYADQATCDADDAALKAAIDNLRSAGIATVAAAGNQSYTDAISSPACLSSAVSVGSTTKSDIVSWFSNSAGFLSILAPGQAILSSVPGGGYAFWSGTSMAAPHVTGAWALAKQASPAATVEGILEALERTGTPVTDTRNGLTRPRVSVDRILFSCTASADPEAGAAPLPVTLEASASGGTEPYTYGWDLGDASTPVAGGAVVHTFATPGDYDASVTVRDAAGLTCARRVAVTVAGPRITRIRKASHPFRLIVEGAGFAPGDSIRIGGLAVPVTSWRSPSRLVALKGAALRAMIPAGSALLLTVTDSDGVTSAPFAFGM